MTDLHDIALWRLVAQRLAGPGLDTPTEVVERLTAMQAQDLPGALASVALRTAAAGRPEVEAALAAGQIVRGWPMRGTLHLTRAEDLPWLTGLLAPRALAAAARRRTQLGLDRPTLERARELATAALVGGQGRTRAELLAAWRAGGVDPAGQRGYHLLGYLSQSGVLCQGPMRDGEQCFVLVDEWIPHPRTLPREAALAELAWRYFRGHGPATIQDLARWAGLTLTDARAGLAQARPALERCEVDGTEYWLDPETPQRLRSARRGARRARGVFLLPGFDELMLGYADRTAVLPPEYADRIVPGGNGVFQPTVVSDGRIVGTWRRTGRGAGPGLSTVAFEPFPDPVIAALPRLAARYPF